MTIIETVLSAEEERERGKNTTYFDDKIVIGDKRKRLIHVLISINMQHLNQRIYIIYNEPNISHLDR